MASFLVILSSGERRLVTSSKPAITIGRRSDNDICIADPLVSRNHAQLFRMGENYYLQDVGSRNGTVLNGVPISRPMELVPGDIIMAGGARVVYEPVSMRPLSDDRELDDPGLLVSTVTQSDGGEKAQAADFLAAVAEVAGSVTRNGELDGLLDSILKLCVERAGAERAGVMLLNGAGELTPRAYYSLAMQNKPFAISTTIARKALRENRGLLISDVVGAEDVSSSESVIGLEIRSAICIPLWNGEKTIGVLYLDTTAHDRQFGEMDLHFFSTLSGMIAEKIENASLTEIAREKWRLDEELNVAREIQSHLFPATLPRIDGYDLAAFNQPCREVGGDYFDIIDTGATFGILIADVVGKGIGAAIIMSNLQAAVRSLAAETGDPSRLLRRINTELCGRIGEDRFVTCCYLELLPGQGRLRYGNAGHNPPLLFRGTGEMLSLAASGIPLGIFPGPDFDLLEAGIEAGDVLLLYTDGVTECGNSSGELFGESRLQSTLARFAHHDAKGILAAIRSALDDFRRDTLISDDVTLVVVKRRVENR